MTKEITVDCLDKTDDRVTNSILTINAVRYRQS